MPLRIAGNVEETCLQLLVRRGYRVFIDSKPEDDSYDWCAEKNGFLFSATNPAELLGLTVIYEDIAPKTDEPYWWRAKTAPKMQTTIARRTKPIVTLLAIEGDAATPPSANASVRTSARASTTISALTRGVTPRGGEPSHPFVGHLAEGAKRQ